MTGPPTADLEISLSGEVRALNGQVGERFPGLESRGLDHPVLAPALSVLGQPVTDEVATRRWRVEHDGWAVEAVLWFDETARVFQVSLRELDAGDQ